MKTIIILSVILMFIGLWGCASWPSYYWPEAKALKKIAVEHNNCAVVAVLTQEHLETVGIESRIVCNRIPADIEPTLLQSLLYPNETTIRTIKGHCWNEVKNSKDGKWYLIDVSQDTGGFEVEYYKEREKK